MKAGLEMLGGLPELVTSPEHLYDVLHQYVLEWYAGEPRHAEFPWRLVILFASGKTIVMAIDDSNVPKKQIFFMHQKSLEFPSPERLGKVACSALVCEAYMRQLKVDEEREYDSLADDPKAVEAVLFNMLTPDKQAVMSCLIDRSGERGATIPKSPFKWLGDDEGKFEGQAIRRQS